MRKLWLGAVGAGLATLLAAGLAFGAGGSDRTKLTFVRFYCTKVSTLCSTGSRRAVYVMNEDGSGERRLSRGTFYEDASPVWSKDHKRILFGRGGAGKATGTYVINADGTGLKKVSPRDYAGTGFALDWSPDGKRIAFSFGFVYVIGLDGKGQRRLASGQQPRWSPDGRRISFEGSDLYIHVFDFTNGKSTRLPRGELRYASGPANWSPDGKELVFTGELDPCDAPGMSACKGVYVINADGTGMRRVTSTAGFISGTVYPSWSPDGKHIAFEEYLQDQTNNDAGHPIEVVNADGSDRHVLSRGARPTDGALYCPRGHLCNENQQIDWAS
jgi:Tol biopolymer transport system component